MITRQAPDDWMRGSEQDAQAFLLHRRVEPADDRDATLPELLGKVVGIEDPFARALGGAQQSDYRTVKDRHIARAFEDLWSFHLAHGCTVPLHLG